jgi:hypothetical protein
MLFALIWLVGLSALSLGCVYYFLAHDATRHGDGQGPVDRQSGRSGDAATTTDGGVDGDSDALVELGESDSSRGLALDRDRPAGLLSIAAIARALEVGPPPLLHRRDST